MTNKSREACFDPKIEVRQSFTGAFAPKMAGSLKQLLHLLVYETFAKFVNAKRFLLEPSVTTRLTLNSSSVYSLLASKKRRHEHLSILFFYRGEVTCNVG